eukprot:SAG11_NODE_16677_length_540_cov_9.149660_1_plen_85_part_10
MRRVADHFGYRFFLLERALAQAKNSLLRLHGTRPLTIRQRQRQHSRLLILGGGAGCSCSCCCLRSDSIPEIQIFPPVIVAHKAKE